LISIGYLGIYIAANIAPQFEGSRPHLHIPSDITRQQELCPGKDQVLTNRTSLPYLKAVARTDNVSTNAGLVANEQHRASHANSACYFTIHHYRLPGGHQVAVHSAIDRNSLPESDHITVDRPIQHKYLTANVQVIIDNFI
jgi:hypothetical protein